MSYIRVPGVIIIGIIMIICFSAIVATGIKVEEDQRPLNIKDNEAKNYIPPKVNVDLPKKQKSTEIEDDTLKRNKQLDIQNTKQNENAMNNINVRIIDEFRNKRTWLEYVPLGVLAALTIIVISVIIFCFTMVKDMKNEVRELIKDIGQKADQFLTARLPDFYRKIDERVADYLEKDFSRPLEERYLKMEFVYLGVWEKVSENMSAALNNKDFPKLINLWNQLYVAQIALRQMLSSDDMEVGNGMAVLMSTAKLRLVPPETLWDFVCLLKKQRRLCPENLALAEEMGRGLEKTFKDCDGS